MGKHSNNDDAKRPSVSELFARKSAPTTSPAETTETPDNQHWSRTLLSSTSSRPRADKERVAPIKKRVSPAVSQSNPPVSTDNDVPAPRVSLQTKSISDSVKAREVTTEEAPTPEVDTAPEVKSPRMRFAHVPDFEKTKLARKDSDADYGLEFEKLKPDETKMTQGSHIIDKENRKRKTMYIATGVSIIFIILVCGYLFIDSMTTAMKPKDGGENNPGVSTDYDSENNFMYQMAESKNPDFLSHVKSQNKEIRVVNNTIESNSSSSAVTISSEYLFANDTSCLMKSETDFCYIAELDKNNAGQPGDKIGSVYAFSNIFKTQFFKEYSNIQEFNANGFAYGASGNIKIADEEKTAIFLADLDGTGYMIVVDNPEVINDIAAHVSSQPVVR